MLSKKNIKYSFVKQESLFNLRGKFKTFPKKFKFKTSTQS